MAKIVLYGGKGCMQCTFMKKFLAQNKSAQEYVDVHEEDKVDFLKEKYNVSAIPVVVVPQSVLDLWFESQKENAKVKKIGDEYVFTGNNTTLLKDLKLPN